MDDKLNRLLEGLEYGELLKLKKDLESGAYLMRHILNMKIHDVETKDRKICASCSKPLESGKEEIYTLLFGTNIKKKASFCGMDCLHDFLIDVKQNKEALLRKDLENRLYKN